MRLWDAEQDIGRMSRASLELCCCTRADVVVTYVIAGVD
jgi:hypothetical protein